MIGTINKWWLYTLKGHASHTNSMGLLNCTLAIIKFLRSEF